jgi:hypothetical protein
MFGKALVGFQLLALFTAAAWAGSITDPAAGIDAGGFSCPISGLTTINPAGSVSNCIDGETSPPGVIDLYNDTRSVITSLTLNFDIVGGLSLTDYTNNGNVVTATIGNYVIGSAAFSCDEGAANPFFEDCSITYNPSDPSHPSMGLLTISFFGVGPPLGSGCYGDHEGILPAPATPLECLYGGPLPTPPGYLEGDYVGHFVLVFNDGFVHPTPQNPSPSTTDGWTNGQDDNAQVIGSSNPTFPFDPQTDLTLAPEPSTWALLAAGVLSFAFRKRRLLHRHR